MVIARQARADETRPGGFLLTFSLWGGRLGLRQLSHAGTGSGAMRCAFDAMRCTGPRTGSPKEPCHVLPVGQGQGEGGDTESPENIVSFALPEIGRRGCREPYGTQPRDPWVLWLPAPTDTPGSNHHSNTIPPTTLVASPTGPTHLLADVTAP